ncbi:methylated-DNA--[protein]-cysteine S-methyltransferase [Paraglaciecola aestuariivivens]
MTTINQAIEYMQCQFGQLEICADNLGIYAIRFVKQATQPTLPNQHTQLAKTQLKEYFSGDRSQFDLALNPQGTKFQHQVWEQLCNIPFAQTCSYADIAKQINNPKAVRAVGAANGRNPITIVVPCHRVIGSNGKLTGYAWGTQIKAGLLALEQSNTK